MANISNSNRTRAEEQEIAAATWRELIAAGFDARLFKRVNATENALWSRPHFEAGRSRSHSGQQRSTHLSHHGCDV